MKLFSKRIGTKIVNFSGKNVQFVDCVAEVDDEFGKQILDFKFPDMYEFGTQPAFHTPTEVLLKTNFKDKEDWYKKELTRFANMNESYKKKISELDQEVKVWKNEYQKLADAKGGTVPEFSKTEEQSTEEQSTEEQSTEEQSTEEQSTEEQSLREDLSIMTKAELVLFGEESGFSMEEVEGKRKDEIIDYIVKKSSE